MKEEKQFLLDEVADYLSHFDAFFIMRYAGLNANLANGFRHRIAHKGGEVHVMRKRLLSKVVEKIGVPLDAVPFEGHLGLVFGSGDVIDLLKTVLEFGKENNGAVELVAAHVEERLYGPEQVAYLAQLPSKQVMQAQLLATLEAPLSQTLAVMEALLCSVPFCLEGRCEQQQGSS